VSPREIEFLAATLPSGTDRSIGVVVAGDDRTAAFEDESVRATVDDANQRDTYALAIAAIRDDVDGMRLAAMNALRAVKGASDEDRARLREALEALEAQGALIGGERSDRWSTRPDGTCDVGEVARSAVRLVWVGRARRRVTMDAQIDEAISARIARSDLVQVISNVLRHAVEAMDGTSKFGWITIGAERCEDRVEIAVRDNGPGIPPSLLKRCFEPGEISRSAEDGQALGLAIARAIIEARGGSVRALSEPDRGTTIVISLPSA
jgi:signal transduction histidine kinase